jgi:membrane protease YdiL (CAAX protease family)
MAGTLSTPPDGLPPPVAGRTRHADPVSEAPTAPVNRLLPERRVLIWEIWLVLGLSLGQSGVYAVVNFLAALTAPKSLAHQQAVLNGSAAPGRPWLDLTYQLLGSGFGIMPVLLVAYLLYRSGESLHTIGADLRRPRFDLVRGAAIAACIGGVGLAFYLATHALGVDLTVVPEALPDVWWRIPVLVLSALQNALVEEVVVLGFLIHRFGQIGWGPNKSVVVSALVRGSYHFYQGVGGATGNAVMGLIFGKLFQRWGRVAPMVVAHTLIDSVAFVGYALLAGHVSWLPT